MNYATKLIVLLVVAWCPQGICGQVPATFKASAELHWHQTPDGFYHFDFSAVENSTNSVCLTLSGSMMGVPTMENLVNVAELKGVKKLEAKFLRGTSMLVLDQQARIGAKLPVLKTIFMESQAEHAKRMTETMFDGVAAQKRELDFMMDLALKDKNISDIFILTKKAGQIQEGMKNLKNEKPCVIRSPVGRWETTFSVTPCFDASEVLASYAEKSSRSRNGTNEFLRGIEFNTEIVVAVPFYDLPVADGKLSRSKANEDMEIIGIQLDFKAAVPTVLGVHTHSEAFAKGVRPGFTVVAVGGRPMEEENYDQNAKGDNVSIELRDEKGGHELLTVKKMKIKRGEMLHWLVNPF